MTPLVIVGAGGFARETAAAAAAANRVRPRWHLLGFVDDDPALYDRQLAGIPVIGGLDVLAAVPDARLVVAVGSPRDYGVRARLVDRLGATPARYAALIHPTAELGTGCRVGVGSVLLAHTVLTVDVLVGAHVAVMPQVVLTHDTVVEDFVTIGSGVRLGGGVRLGAGCYLGAGALIREGRVVGAGSLVGMGSVVLHDIPPGQVWAGNPARYLREAAPQVLATDGAGR